MPHFEKKDIWFDSADGKNRVAASLYANPAKPVRCVVQLSHGMCEFVARYEEFADVLAQQGIALCGNDHLGHGASAATPDDYGYLGGFGGRACVLEDLHTMNTLARETWPGVPLVMLGHSMGSFYARRYAVVYPQTIDGLIISGTGGPNPLAGVGASIARVKGTLQGDHHRSRLVHNMAFGAYNKKIDNPATPYDWISRDEEIVRIYNAEPRCTFRFTVSGFHELFKILQEVSTPEWAAAFPKDLPVLMIAGEADPVGDYGKGVVKVRDMLAGAGVHDITMILYPGARHEVLNETCRTEVYADVVTFLQRFTAPEVQA